jgi:hypothetical protein
MQFIVSRLLTSGSRETDIICRRELSVASVKKTSG